MTDIGIWMQPYIDVKDKAAGTMAVLMYVGGIFIVSEKRKHEKDN
jgi:hypothetical protein